MPTVNTRLKKKTPAQAQVNQDKAAKRPAGPVPTVSRQALERAVDTVLRKSPAAADLVLQAVKREQEQIKATLQIDQQIQAAASRELTEVEQEWATNIGKSLRGWDEEYKALRKHIDDQLKRIEAQANVTITVQKPDAADVKLEGLFHKNLPRLIKQVTIGNPVWLAGPTQSGKSFACETIANAMGIPYTYHAFGPTQTETKLSGFQNAMGDYVPTELYYAVKYGWLFLGDEADNCQANVLIWMNNGVSNGLWAFPRSLVTKLRQEGDEAEAAALEKVIEAGGQVRQHDNFRIILSANTWGEGSFIYIGRNQLDPSSLARFDKVMWNYDEDLERKVALAKYGHFGEVIDQWVDHVQLVRKATYQIKDCPVIITPSHTLRGARNLAGGLEWDYVAETSLMEGVDSSMRKKIEGEMQHLERYA